MESEISEDDIVTGEHIAGGTCQWKAKVVSHSFLASVKGAGSNRCIWKK